MNLFRLSLAYIKRKKLNTLLNVLLLALGVATIVVLLLFSQQFESSLSRNSRGIDAVVGAKGSPLQLILASVYHLDVPTGNIPLREAAALLKNPAVKSAIPLSLGDSWRGFRVVGTVRQYLALYEARLSAGRIWSGTLEVVLGAAVARETGATLGQVLTSNHGFDEGGSAHGDHAMTVVGILAESGSVLDRLVLASLETVWEVHQKPAEATGEHADEHQHSEHQEAAAPATPPIAAAGAFQFDEADSMKEVTSLLIQYRSPMAAVLFPRFVNGQTSMQAAAPAFETARLFSLLGVGLNALRTFGAILIATAALSLFIALYNALKERRYDLAVMRTLGAGRWKLLWHILLEGLILTLMGTALGLLLGHGTASLLGARFEQARQMQLDGWLWLPQENWLVLATIAVGLLAALLPAIQAWRSDIARILQRG